MTFAASDAWAAPQERTVTAEVAGVRSIALVCEPAPCSRTSVWNATDNPLTRGGPPATLTGITNKYRRLHVISDAPSDVVIATITGEAVGAAGIRTSSYDSGLGRLTVTLVRPAGFLVGDRVTVSGTGLASWDRTWTIVDVPNTSSFVVEEPTSPGALAGNPLAQVSKTLTGASWAGGVVTYTTYPSHGYATGDQVTVAGAGSYDASNATIIVLDASRFTVARVSDPGTWAGTGFATLTTTNLGANRVSLTVTATPSVGVAGTGTVVAEEATLSALGVGDVLLSGINGSGTQVDRYLDLTIAATAGPAARVGVTYAFTVTYTLASV